MGFHSEVQPRRERLVTVTLGDKTAKIWNVADGSMVASLRGHAKRILDAQFSPDGSKIVTASADKTVKIWNITNGTLIGDLKGHFDLVRTALFSFDCNVLYPLLTMALPKYGNVARYPLQEVKIML